MTESDEKRKDFPQKKKINKEMEKILDHPLFVCYQPFFNKKSGYQS